MSTFDDAWNSAYEGLPADNEDINLGAGRIRDLKIAIRERMLVDHMWDDGLAVASEDGKHNQVTLRPAGSAPTLDTGDGALYSFVIGGNTELFYKDSSGRVLQLTAQGGLNGNIITSPAGFTVSGPLIVTGAATLDGALAVAGNATLEASAAVDGNLEVFGSTTLVGALLPGAGVGPINNNANFFLAVDGSGNSVLTMGAAGATLKFNQSLSRWEFFVANSLVAHFP